MSNRSRVACGLARATLALTVAALAIVGASVLFRVQGGAEHKFVDIVQFAAFWGYLFLTPVLAASALLLRSESRRCRMMSWALLAFWGCVLIAGTFVHS